MDGIDYITKFCDDLLENTNNVQIKSHITTRSKVIITHESDDVSIQKQDIENLANFVQIWTDIIETPDVLKQFKESEFADLCAFEKDNSLYNLGFFYIHINNNLSPMEFFGLLSKIPWELLRSPGLNQIPFASVAHLFGENSEKVSMQLMVLGDFYKFWILINPYCQMTQTHETTRLILSSMGTLAVLISPGFIKDCQQLIENVKFESTTQS